MNRRDFLRQAAAAAAAAATLPVRAAGAAPKPNFVVIFTDDQGYQDLGCYGSPRIRTPHIDRLAAEGVKFTDFYSASPVCTPSRTALLTGCYPRRVGLANHVLFPWSRHGIHPDEVTLAEILRARGYATQIVGKWHLGHHPEFLPTRHGFDHYYGIPYSNDMPTVAPDGQNGSVLLRDEKVEEHPTDHATLTKRYTAEAVKFIAANRDRPFFLYLPHTMPHTPLAASDAFRGKSPRGLYGDCIEEIDWSTGEILKALREHGLDDRTLVMYSSDNGPWLIRKEHGGAALPLRDGKGTTYEGGMRVPCLMRWPGRIPPGRVCREVAATIDILPTFARLAGGAPPGDRVIDGRDLAPLILGAEGAKSPHEAYFYHTAYGELQAVRSGRWKLRRLKPGESAAELFDLEADIGETKDVAAEHAGVVARLAKLMDDFEAEISQHVRPSKYLSGGEQAEREAQAAHAKAQAGARAKKPAKQ